MSVNGADSLPVGWAQATVGELIPADGVFIDGDWVESKDQDPDGEVRLIQLADIGDGLFIDKSNRHLTKKKAYELGCTFLDKSDLLVARMPDPLGRCCLFPLSGDERYVTVVDVCIVRVSESQVNPKFLAYAINSARIRAEIADYQSGSTRKRISRGNLAKIRLPIAPLPEQRRIVAKIEELFSELDKGIEALTTAREQLKAYRQSVLKHAFEGKLTEKWRAQNPDKALTPAARLVCIRAAIKARFDKSILAWEANGEKGPKPLTPISYGERESPDFSSLPPLPQGWAYVPFSELAYSIRNGISKKPDEKGPLRIFRISAVRPMEFDMSDFRHINDDPEFLSYRLQRGDIVFTRYNGSRNYVGVAALYRSDEEFVYPDKLIRCDVRLPLIDAGYIEKAVNCGASRAFIESRIRTTAGQAGISGADLKAMPVPICSVEEQKVINEILEEQLSGIVRLETELEARLAQAEAMRQSILKKAFSGQLVAQCPNDEPASVLLERIRAERERAPAKNGRNGRNGDAENIKNGQKNRKKQFA